MKNENTNNENEKRGEAAAKQDPQANDAKYTRLEYNDIKSLIRYAADMGFRENDLALRVEREATINEEDETPGTFTISFRAKTFREAAAVPAAIVGAAFKRGLYAAPGDECLLEPEDGVRVVTVFVAADDYITDAGKSVLSVVMEARRKAYARANR